MLHKTCATCSELLSYISTMGSTCPRCPQSRDELDIRYNCCIQYQPGIQFLYPAESDIWSNEYVKPDKRLGIWHQVIYQFQYRILPDIRYPTHNKIFGRNFAFSPHSLHRAVEVHQFCHQTEY